MGKNYEINKKSNLLSKKKTFRSLKSIFIITIISFSVLLFNHKPLLSQQSTKDMLFIPPANQPKSFFEILFNLSDIKSGTKIVDKERKENAKDKGQRKLNEDTTKKENKITSIRQSSEKVSIYLDLLDYDSKIQIGFYNLLGKKVMDVFDGIPYKDTEYGYERNISILPNGVYLCIVIGKNFKLREKFVISR